MTPEERGLYRSFNEEPGTPFGFYAFLFVMSLGLGCLVAYFFPGRIEASSRIALAVAIALPLGLVLVYRERGWLRLNRVDVLRCRCNWVATVPGPDRLFLVGLNDRHVLLLGGAYLSGAIQGGGFPSSEFEVGYVPVPHVSVPPVSFSAKGERVRVFDAPVIAGIERLRDGAIWVGEESTLHDDFRRWSSLMDKIQDPRLFTDQLQRALAAVWESAEFGVTWPIRVRVAMPDLQQHEVDDLLFKLERAGKIAFDPKNTASRMQPAMAVHRELPVATKIRPLVDPPL
jgi:hypothetical protein